MNDSFATRPGGLTLSDTKLRRLRPDLYRSTGRIRRALSRLTLSDGGELKRLADHLLYGDAQPAVVMSAQPLLVAAYTTEIDCVAMLEFPPELAREHSLSVQDGLMTVNVYWTYEDMEGKVDPDLFPGKSARGIYASFYPLIAEFVSEDTALIEEMKASFSKYERHRVWQLGEKYRKKHAKWIRDGRPGYAHLPRKR